MREESNDESKRGKPERERERNKWMKMGGKRARRTNSWGGAQVSPPSVVDDSHGKSQANEPDPPAGNSLITKTIK